MRFLWRAIFVLAVAVCFGQTCDLRNILPGQDEGEEENLALEGINGGQPASLGIPELGGPVTVQIISESSLNAQVVIRFLVDGVETRRAQLQAPAFASLEPVGPDLADVVEVSGEYADGTPIPPVRLVLGEDFFENDLRIVVLSDPLDACPLDPDKTDPGYCGCGQPETDSDGDGLPDCVDGCPEDSSRTAPGVCGCGTPETDRDDDGTLDCVDQCPDDSGKTAPGVCGCGIPDLDSDSDGVPDCNDACPEDSGKTTPGVCGCGVSDVDTDEDGVPDCLDGCPNNSAKIEPGICGCEALDIDADEDGTLNCLDGCPLDTDKTAPGVCGCGVPDEDLDENGILDCLDPDGDGILSDGDESGVIGDNPCTGGETEGCDDNCPYNFNPYQEDQDFDGIGTACEIRADFDEDGDVDLVDFSYLQACLGGEAWRDCAFTNLDQDPNCTIDGGDVAAFQWCLTGEGLPVAEFGHPACWGENVSYFCESQFGS